MKNKISELYLIKVENLQKLSENTYKVFTSDSSYILKRVPSLKNENIYLHIHLSKIPFFCLPLLSINNNYVEEINHNYYILSYYYQDEASPLKELRLPFYIKAISYLHQNSIYPLKVNDGYFNESLDYIQNKIDVIREQIESQMYYLERRDYHSPSEWYFINSFNVFNDSLNLSQKYLDLLKEEFESLQNVELTLTYQNFDINHILIKEEKIISLEKISYAPCIYDLVDFITNTYNYKIDTSELINSYLAINPLKLYQKYWLLALLMIPILHKEIDEKKEIESIYLSLNYLKICHKIKEILLGEES